jgi:hypothetical protein
MIQRKGRWRRRALKGEYKVHIEMSSSNKEKYATAKQIEEYLLFHNSAAGNLKQQPLCDIWKVKSPQTLQKRV